MSSITKNSTGPDLALIKKYAEVGDRVSPPVFVGRHAEIGIVEKNCRAVVDLSKEGKKTAGALVVFGALRAPEKRRCCRIWKKPGTGTRNGRLRWN